MMGMMRMMKMGRAHMVNLTLGPCPLPKDRDSSILVQCIKQARKLQATLVRNYYPATQRLTGVRCRATSVAKNDHR